MQYGDSSKRFTFDSVFSASSSQRRIYDVTTAPLVQSVLEGFARQVVGVDAGNALVDRQLAPKIDPMMHTEYAGNFESCAYDEQIVAHAAKGVESR